MIIQDAIKFCKEYGWNVTKGKYFLEDNGEDRVIFQTDEELIKYAEELKKSQ